MTILETLLGPSWRSTTLGVLSIMAGLVLFLAGWGTGEATLKVMGLGLIPTGILGLVTRDNQASVVAHEESKKGIEEAKGDHIDNQVKIAHLEEKVDAVPAVVADAVDTRAPKVIANVILPIVAAAVEQAVQNQPRQERR